MVIGHPLAGYGLIKQLVLSRKRVVLGFLSRQDRIRMKLSDTQISSIHIYLNFFADMHVRVLKKLKIMAFPIGKGYTDNLTIFLVNYNLCFQCMLLFLPGIVVSLPLFGRSIGVSVASTRTTSYSMSVLSSAFLPGKEKLPSRINVYSIHLIA